MDFWVVDTSQWLGRPCDMNGYVCWIRLLDTLHRFGDCTYRCSMIRLVGYTMMCIVWLVLWIRYICLTIVVCCKIGINEIKAYCFALEMTLWLKLWLFIKINVYFEMLFFRLTPLLWSGLAEWTIPLSMFFYLQVRHPGTCDMQNGRVEDRSTTYVLLAPSSYLSRIDP